MREAARDIPVAGTYDVIVAGAGPAGIAAAIEAGRSGARTLLIETHGCLGGVWTAGYLTWILDNKNKPGLMQEIMQELQKKPTAATVPSGSTFAFDAEDMKLLLEELCAKAKVDILYFTRVVAAMKEQRKLSYVVTESKSGREAWKGNVFIDCTGDGDLAARAGCQYDYGDSSGQGQPMSLLCLVTGVQYKEIQEFVRDETDSKTGSPSKKRLESEIVRGGVSPSYTRPGLYPIRDDLFMLMTHHAYGFKGTDARQVTEATLNGRMELHKIVNALRSLGGAWKDLKIVATGEQIGVRESRRIKGLYTVTMADIQKGIRHEDAVCRVTFGIDVHSVKKEDETKQSYNRGVKMQPYDIPIRALIAKDVDGLMMAGRCISGDFIAHSSYRVTGNAVAMGQAAGRVAALASKSNALPQQVPWKEVAWHVE
ncbi:FAD-dependent oxidoreductase [Rhabdobacter roseus]